MVYVAELKVVRGVSSDKNGGWLAAQGREYADRGVKSFGVAKRKVIFVNEMEI